MAKHVEKNLKDITELVEEKEKKTTLSHMYEKKKHDCYLQREKSKST